MKAGFASFIGPAALAAASMACAGNGGGTYTAANEAVAEGLPVFPGAETERREDSRYVLTEPEGPSGWTSTIIYRIPADRAADVSDIDVVDFYMKEMAEEWQRCREDTGIKQPIPAGQTPGPDLGKILIAHFQRGSAQVTVNTDGLNELGRSDTFDVTVDHNAYRNFCTGEDLRLD